MSYVKFNEKNISTEWVISEQEGDGWYEVPEEHEGHNFYKLENGIVVPLVDNDLDNYKNDLFVRNKTNLIKLAVSRILTDTDWLVQRHTEQTSLDAETSLEDSEYQSLIAYRSSLRNLSNQEITLEEFESPEYPFKERYPNSFADELESICNNSFFNP
jgi:hypothetical protein